MLRSMAPFPGGVDLSSIETLAADVVPGTDPLPLLQRLVDASLVVVDPTLTRYRLLFTVRAFLLDELARHGELREAEERFLEWACDTSAELGDALFGTDEGAADRRLRAELDNLRAARDLARRHDRLDACIDITVATTEASIWRDLRELWAWAWSWPTRPPWSGIPARSRSLRGRPSQPGSSGPSTGARPWPSERSHRAPARGRPAADGALLVRAGGGGALPWGLRPGQRAVEQSRGRRGSQALCRLPVLGRALRRVRR